jgi:diguanylate cyclase (GGDEF)-like protein
MSTPLRALIVEDSEDDTLLLVKQLQQGGFIPEYTRVETPEDMRARLEHGPWDIVFSDFTMPRFSAFEALELLHASGLDLPFIIVSGTIGEDRAVAAMKAGAHDYILKDSTKRLLPAVERELREAEMRHERRRTETRVQQLAYFDPLTGLPNRTRFMELAQEAFAEAQAAGHPLALLLLDVDRFKEVNDTLGHAFGDTLLIEVAARLRRALFRHDLVARLGGDEFGVLLPRLRSVDDVRLVIQKITAALAAPAMVNEVPIMVEASIGIALAPDHAPDAEGLLQRADVAMYTAKQSGGVFAIYDRALDPHSPQRLALLGELRQGIERGELVLHFQPKIELASGRTIGAEALVRWQHPQRGLVPPMEFIPPAEHTGLIHPLTEWVLAQALAECARWRKQGHDLQVAVNLSARSLHDPQLLARVTAALGEQSLPPDALMLEITESAIIVDPARALETLTRLNRQGIRIALDDFGTGYSSLGFIRKLPVHEIKIDKSFVLGMLQNRSDEVIARIVVDLARNLRLKVVAEGVEDNATLDHLNALGCHHAQGYFISRPLTADAFSAWLDRPAR